MEYLTEFIIGIIIFIVSTEIVFFKYTIKIDDMGFGLKKFLAVLIGICFTLIIFIFPCIFANTPASGLGYEEAAGNIVYIWYYGVIISLALFIKINHIFYKKFALEQQSEVKQ